MIESEYSCLVSDFSRKTFRFSTLSIIFAMGFSDVASLMVRCVLSIPSW